MQLPRPEMPIRSVADITLTSEESRVAARETKPADVQGIRVAALVDKVSDRYSFSKYVLDPCKFSWPKWK